MTPTDDKGIGIKGWISGSKPKPRTEGVSAERVVLDKRRIAILPFSNISPDTKDEYFADGMTEELISTLSKISGLVVIARTSVMRYKGGQMNINDVARELQVGTVLEGSVRKAGERLRITVQLIDAQTSGHLWAESYDRELRDVFAIQSDISKTIAQTLKVQLLPKEKSTIENKQTTSPEAHTNYLLGRFHWNERNPAALTRATKYFEKAIQIDPEYAPAYSGLADSYFIMGQWGFANPLTNYQNARTFARKALEINENLPEAHATLAATLVYHDYDWIRAEEEYKKSIELNPNYATAHQWYHQLLLCQERMDEAYEEITKALELDPLSLIINDNLANYFSIRRKFDLAERQSKKVLEMDPNFLSAHMGLMWTYLISKRAEEASQEVSVISRLSNNAPIAKYALAVFYVKTGKVAEAKNLFSDLERLRASGEHISSQRLAELSFLNGDVDNGFKWLERAYEDRDGWLPYMRVNEIFETFKSDPRYLSLLKKVGLTQSESSN